MLQLTCHYRYNILEKIWSDLNHSNFTIATNFLMEYKIVVHIFKF